MAKLTSEILFKGRLGDVSAYTMKGASGIILRTKGGATKEKIKTAPQFEMTRRNCAEFSGCVIAGKALHRALLSLKHLSDHNFAPHLNGAVRKLQQLNTEGDLGQRAILLTRYGAMLEGFDLNKTHRLGDIIKPGIACVVNRESGEAAIHLPALMPGLNFHIPWNNPMFRVVATLSTAKDVTWQNNRFAGATEPLHAHFPLHTTAWYKTGQAMPAQVLQLQALAVPADDEALIISIGMEMGQPGNNGSIKAERGKGCARIVKVS
ncbi:hypothetical protein HNQ91_000218 [Filimonas zeae]|uniref:Uncharacterized protein n=1 Tax=Filimonas zeae TaxID=1737353 RepID=A0A917IN37_9BACT|nr:hypothetical protein [Filimonas zeae]MDR6337196.1 hypothetical protein [Filimonas zeae]GGH57443.1 hypothetical protein GCM10011379_02140 [Filimonas zeae]